MNDRTPIRDRPGTSKFTAGVFARLMSVICSKRRQSQKGPVFPLPSLKRIKSAHSRWRRDRARKPRRYGSDNKKCWCPASSEDQTSTLVTSRRNTTISSPAQSRSWQRHIKTGVPNVAHDNNDTVCSSGHRKATAQQPMVQR